MQKFKYKSLEQATKEFQERNFDQRYIGASLSDIRLPDEEAKKILTWTQNPKHILLFHGIPGTGKTYFCSALVEWALQTFNSVRYHNEKQLLSKLRNTIREGSDDYANYLEYLIDDDLVMLDDVGSGINPERVSYRDLEWRREVFFHFLDVRYNSTKPTVITSNFSYKDFNDIYSERIVSRLFAKENTIISLFEGVEDKRQTGI